MLCLIYPLRAAGAKLSAEAVKSGAVLALFQFQDHPVYPQKRASMHAPHDGVPLASIDCAKILKIQRGILVTGHEHDNQGRYCKQTWWCVPIDPEGRPISAA